ncbi:hypothetical protein [Roseimaritima ulvae]|uniref:Uncharacterized protein n=1 Tax=Roseimaritima ulvae TaxID=980254 RepID=A0A5B9QPL2_9BACT|nr:hypothetical protein [Roseimaritima ulvae]QEG41027.1 hypothetical protein UC8_30450 [Roseimaritima ulvae]
MRSRFNDARKNPRSGSRGQNLRRAQNHARDAWFADLAGDRESLQRVHELEQEWWSELDIAFDDVAFDGPPLDAAPLDAAPLEADPAASIDVELDLQGTLADRRRSLLQRLPRFGV